MVAIFLLACHHQKTYTKAQFLFKYLSVNSKSTGKLHLKGWFHNGWFETPAALIKRHQGHEMDLHGTPIYFETPIDLPCNQVSTPMGSAVTVGLFHLSPQAKWFPQSSWDRLPINHLWHDRYCNDYLWHSHC